MPRAIAPPNLAEAERLVREMLRDHRRAGMKLPDCLAAVAQWFGVSPRRVRALHYHEAARVPADEYQLMLDGWDRYLDAKADDLERQLAAIRARRASR